MSSCSISHSTTRRLKWFPKFITTLGLFKYSMKGETINLHSRVVPLKTTFGEILAQNLYERVAPFSIMVDKTPPSPFADWECTNRQGQCRCQLLFPFCKQSNYTNFNLWIARYCPNESSFLILARTIAAIISKLNERQSNFGVPTWIHNLFLACLFQLFATGIRSCSSTFVGS